MFRKNKGISITTCVKGEVNLTDDGLSIIPDSGLLLSPIDGRVSFPENTKNTYLLTHENGVVIQVVIGDEAVNKSHLEIKPLVSDNTVVGFGAPILQVDLDAFDQESLSSLVQIKVVSDHNVTLAKKIHQKQVVRNDVIMYVK